MYALTQGLAGVKDTATAFHSVELSPRWTAAGVKHARVTLRYPASRGYVTYEYWQNSAEKSIRLTATGDASNCRLRVLLPQESGVFKP